MATGEQRTSLISFVGGASISLLRLVTFLSHHEYIWQSNWFLIIVTYILVINSICFLCSGSQRFYQISLRACFLGVVFGLGILLSAAQTTWQHFGWYMAALSFFHFSEYFTTAVTNPSSLALESFLLDHSTQYKLAAAASWLEFAIECHFLPGLKQLHWVSVIGLILVIGGEVLRKASMLTAWSNFNHYVQHSKQSDHELVTHGVYRLFRHPSYVGWFYWSIGTQIILCNPICLVAYTYVSWKFFQARILEEEGYLLEFFGKDYVAYQKKVGTGLPFIKGFTFNF